MIQSERKHIVVYLGETRKKATHAGHKELDTAEGMKQRKSVASLFQDKQ